MGDKPSNKSGPTTAKYPSGNIRQHKMLATGGGLVKANTREKGANEGWKGTPPGRGSFSSSGDTGDAPGPVPKPKMTPA